MRTTITVRGVIVGVVMIMFWSAALANPPGRMVDIGDRHLHVIETPGDGPTVVLEAGGGAFSSFWHAIQSSIRDDLGLHAISYDRAGLGWSEPGSLPYRIQDKSDDLNALLTALNIDAQIILVATSYGGWVAQDFSARYPERIRALVLVEPNSSYFFAQYPEKAARIVADGMKGPSRGLKRLGIKMQRNWLAKRVGIRRSDFAPLLTDGHQVAQRQMLAAFAMTSSSIGETIFPDVPTIMISRGRPQSGFPWGSDASETAWRDGHERLIEHLSTKQHWIAQDAGHAVVFDQPDIVLDAIATAVEN